MYFRNNEQDPNNNEFGNTTAENYQETRHEHEHKHHKAMPYQMYPMSSCPWMETCSMKETCPVMGEHQMMPEYQMMPEECGDDPDPRFRPPFRHHIHHHIHHHFFHHRRY